MLDEKAKEARREYLRSWRKKNPDKVKAYNQTYWERRAEREAVKNGRAKQKTGG